MSAEDTEVGWQTVIAGRRSFDLVALTGIEEEIGSVQLEPGTYNQVCFTVVEASVTFMGIVLTPTFPSEPICLVHSYELIAGETTVLTMDFDAAQSVSLSGYFPPSLTPVVDVLVRMRPAGG